jgi:glycosyltransferase involved in cell wall biosynthesis
VQFLLPFYGDPVLMRETVSSVLAQTDENWTLVVVDDCYPDPDVAKWFSSLDDPRIRYTRNESQLGANGNYRRAVALSDASRIVMLGADDRLLPNYLERCRELLMAADPDVLQPGVAVIDGEGHRFMPIVDRVKTWVRPRTAGAPRVVRGESATVSVMHGNWTYFPSLMWRRSLVVEAGFRDYHIVQDLALLVDLLMSGADLMLDPEVTFEYRRHSDSDSSIKTVTGARFEEERDYYSMIADELRQLGWKSAARAARMRWTSRAHALALIPTAARSRRSPRPLLTHALTDWT